MLTALGCRGPDSAGVALFGTGNNGLLLRVKLGERGYFAAVADEVLKRIEAVTTVREHSVIAAYLRLVVDDNVDVQQLVEAIEDKSRFTFHVSRFTPHSADSIEAVSMGHRLRVFALRVKLPSLLV
jgi:hypothetical protein